MPGLVGHGHKSKGGRSRTLCVRVGAALLSQEHTLEKADGRWNSRTALATRQARSGWPDLNRRSPAPQAGGLPGFPTS